MKRVVSDCRKSDGDQGCSVTIAGTETEVMPLAIHHMVKDHGQTDTPELRDQIKTSLKEEM